MLTLPNVVKARLVLGSVKKGKMPIDSVVTFDVNNTATIHQPTPEMLQWWMEWVKENKKK